MKAHPFLTCVGVSLFVSIGCGSSEAPPPPEELDGYPGEYTYTSDAREWRILIPSAYDQAVPIPLIVLFHGACGSGAEMYRKDGTELLKVVAEPSSFILVVPSTKGGCDDGSEFCQDFILWPPTCDLDGTSAPKIVAEMDEIVALIDEVGRHWRIDPRQIHAMGYSDGGWFTGIGGVSHSDFFASLTVVSMGFGPDYPLVPPNVDRKIPIQFLVGANDDRFRRPAEESEPFFAAQGHDTRIIIVPNADHDFDDVVAYVTAQDIFGWMVERPMPLAE